MSTNDNISPGGGGDPDPEFELQDLDDVNVTQTRGTRGELLESSSRVTPPQQSTAVGGVLGYLNGFLGQTPIPPRPPADTSPRDPTTADLFRGDRRGQGDDAEEFGGIPVPEEGVDYPSDEDDGEPIQLVDLDPTPEELIAELLRGRVIYGEDGGTLDPAAIIPAMQELLRKRNREEVTRALKQQRSHRKLLDKKKRVPVTSGKLVDSIPGSEFTGIGLPYQPKEDGTWLGSKGDLQTTVRTPSGESLAVQHPWARWCSTPRMEH